ncbi:tyrosine-type recombinase/integrase [Deinococcus enclensis]|uniref:Site-specific recombinase XerD n=1 Tax=Deinococcus enclensis TaxID=1049582 RepID=A0ABT9MHN3_9DEIO|nr:tyrosine-type recombinase/integrase [Deinococcus enclensis]MDP9766103.1 site-specific recombinase XerD [Deinococcus enclensis]
MSLFDVFPAFEGYLLQEEGLSPATVRQYRADNGKLATWLQAEFGDRGGVRWEEVGVRDLRVYMQKHHPAPARARRLVSSWKKLWRYLKDIEHQTMKPGPEELKTPKLPARLPKALTTAEVSRLLTAARSQGSEDKALRDWALLAFLYGTGCRISEVLNLTFEQVEFDHENVPVAIRVIGKGDKERQVYLSPTAQRALQAWLKARRKPGAPAGPFVFTPLKGAGAGGPFSARTIEAATRRAGERAGLRPEQSTPHKLRHSHATALVEAGRPIEEVQEVLGHASIATTQIYTRVNRNRLKAAAASLPDVLE